MGKKDTSSNESTYNIDPKTGMVKGSSAYNEYYFPKKEKQTDIFYKTCDGKYVSTMEKVRMYNQMYYERMKKQYADYIEKKDRNR